MTLSERLQNAIRIPLTPEELLLSSWNNHYVMQIENEFVATLVHLEPIKEEFETIEDLIEFIESEKIQSRANSSASLMLINYIIREISSGNIQREFYEYLQIALGDSIPESEMDTLLDTYIYLQKVIFCVFELNASSILSAKDDREEISRCLYHRISIIKENLIGLQLDANLIVMYLMRKLLADVQSSVRFKNGILERKKELLSKSEYVSEKLHTFVLASLMLRDMAYEFRAFNSLLRKILDSVALSALQEDPYMLFVVDELKLTF